MRCSCCRAICFYIELIKSPKIAFSPPPHAHREFSAHGCMMYLIPLSARDLPTLTIAIFCLRCWSIWVVCPCCTKPRRMLDGLRQCLFCTFLRSKACPTLAEQNKLLCHQEVLKCLTYLSQQYLYSWDETWSCQQSASQSSRSPNSNFGDWCDSSSLIISRSRFMANLWNFPPKLDHTHSW